MSEIWKDIKDYEGYYQISNLGMVKGLSRKYHPKDQILKIWKNQYGYPMISISIDSKSKHFLIHRLVAMAFIPNPDNKPFVNHIDGEKSNYTIENLEWCSRKENDKHAMETGLRTNSGYRKKVKIYKDGVELYFDAGYYASDYIGCSKGAVNHVANPRNRQETIYGWKVEWA